MLSKKSKRNSKRTETPNFSGQHLLINKGLIKQLVELADIQSSDLVLDIGAGQGAMTLPLAKKAAHVIAIEYDSAFVQKLIIKAREKNNIKIKQIDFLKYDFPKKPFNVVSNIPYSITTPIFAKMFDHPVTVPLQRAVFLIEKGAAKRFTANPITDPRILKWRMWFDFQLVRTVSPDHFSPPPRIDSAVLTVCRRKNPDVPVHHHRGFMALAKHGLRYPYSPIYVAFAGVFTPPQITRLVRMLGVQRTQPVCSLNEQQWGRLYLTMLQHVPRFRWPKG